MADTAVGVTEFLACEMAVLRALELAGKRCRGMKFRNGRDQRATTGPDYLLYTRLPVPVAADDCDRVLAGAWDHLALVLPGRPGLYATLDGYVRGLLVTRGLHTRDGLVAVLAGRDG